VPLSGVFGRKCLDFAHRACARDTALEARITQVDYTTEMFRIFFPPKVSGQMSLLNPTRDEWYTPSYSYNIYNFTRPRLATLMYILIPRPIYLSSTPNLATSSCLICSCRVFASPFVRVFSRLR
jgi:hypothetical protein